MFIVEQHQTALEFDQIPRHAMSSELKSDHEAANICEKITSSKAAAIIKMLHDIVGESVFKSAINMYINENM